MPKDTFICDDKSITIHAEIANSKVNNQVWNTNDTGLSITTNLSGLYWIEVQSECGISRDSVNVSPYFTPTLELGDPIENCDDKEIEINAYQKNIIDYLWSNGSRLPKNSIRYDNLGLIVSNFCGSASDSLLIDNANCECKIYIPNAFTPSNDEINKRFTLTTNCANLKGTLRVYNRWGEKLFETTDLKNGWDGCYKTHAIKGIYLGIFEINLPGNERKILSNTFHLL